MNQLVVPPLLAALMAVGALRGDAQVVARATPELAAPSAETVLEHALGNFYAQGYALVRLTNYHGKTKGLERELKVWTKGQSVLGKFVQPASVRGTAFLVIPPAEKEDTSSDSVANNQYFIYLPAFGRIRRISGAQRADPFFGTYLSQSDVEAHSASDFSVVSMRNGELGGESVYELTLRPRFDAGYSRAVVSVATRDFAPLRIEEYAEGRKTPIRVIEGRRAWMEARSGHVVPDKLVVSEGESDAHTVVIFSDRNLHANIPNSVFTTD